VTNDYGDGYDVHFAGWMGFFLPIQYATYQGKKAAGTSVVFGRIRDHDAGAIGGFGNVFQATVVLA